MSINAPLIHPVPLTYRTNVEIDPPASRGVANGPLKLSQIDGNMKSIELGFERAQQNVDALDAAISLKADKYRPEFSGYIRVPVANESNVQQFDKKEGLLLGVKYTDKVTKTDYTAISFYADNKWQKLATVEGTTGYVSKYGDTLYGRLTGTTAEFDHGEYIFSLKSLPPVLPENVSIEVKEGEKIEDKREELRNLMDKVATEQWVRTQINNDIKKSLGGEAGNITASDLETETITITGDEDSPTSVTVKQGIVVLEKNNTLALFNDGRIIFIDEDRNGTREIGGSIEVKRVMANLDFGRMPDPD